MSFEIRLIPHDQPVAAVLAAIVPPLAGDEAADFVDGVEQMRATDRPAPWGLYVAWRDGVAVGSCGFTNVPGPGDPPEIGYMTFPAARGSGVATAMTRAMLAIAADHGVPLVIAHTLPVDGTSSRVLQRCGFVFAGDADDPDDGPVWRWERAIG